MDSKLTTIGYKTKEEVIQILKHLNTYVKYSLLNKKDEVIGLNDIDETTRLDLFDVEAPILLATLFRCESERLLNGTIIECDDCGFKTKCENYVIQSEEKMIKKDKDLLLDKDPRIDNLK